MNKLASVIFTPHERDKLKKIYTESEYFYHKLHALKALITIFDEALWRMCNDTESLPTDNTVLPAFADVLEHHACELVDKSEELYRGFESIYSAKVEQLTEGGASDE